MQCNVYNVHVYKTLKNCECKIELLGQYEKLCFQHQQYTKYSIMKEIYNETYF